MNAKHWNFQFGRRGTDVALWQNLLLADGWDLGHWGADGVFGKMTHNATVAAEKARGMRATGTVYPMLVQAMLLRRHQPRLQAVKPWQSWDFIQAKNYTPTSGRAINKIVLHSIEGIEASTSAERTAEWFSGMHGNAPRASAGYCVDDDSIVQCVRDEDVAWHAPGANHDGIGIEQAGFARQTRGQWLDPYGVRMLENVGNLIAILAKRHTLPIVLLGVDELRSDPDCKGVTTHQLVGEAFGKTDHWDPGPGYPMDHVLEVGREAFARLAA